MLYYIMQKHIGTLTWWYINFFHFHFDIIIIIIFSISIWFSLSFIFLYIILTAVCYATIPFLFSPCPLCLSWPAHCIFSISSFPLNLSCCCIGWPLTLSGWGRVSPSVSSLRAAHWHLTQYPSGIEFTLSRLSLSLSFGAGVNIPCCADCWYSATESAEPPSQPSGAVNAARHAVGYCLSTMLTLSALSSSYLLPVFGPLVLLTNTQQTQPCWLHTRENHSHWLAL